MAWVALPRLAALAGLAIVLTLSGCTRSRSTVDGRLVLNGQAYQTAENEQILLGFESLDLQPEQSFSARVRADGSFSVTGVGGGIPAGKYRVTVRSMRIGVTDAEDPFKGMFSGPQSPLTCEVAPGKCHLQIDLGARTVTSG